MSQPEETQLYPISFDGDTIHFLMRRGSSGAWIEVGPQSLI